MNHGEFSHQRSDIPGYRALALDGTVADIADATAHVVTRPRYMAVSELPVRPTEQER